MRLSDSLHVLVVAVTGLVAAAQADAQIEEVVVTAQHRTERLQDVPISAQVIGADAIARQNLNSLVALSQTVPSVHIAGTIGRSGELFIRGLGSGNNPSFDQSVGTFIDGIYHGRARTSAGTFLDLERVEILKGPQSTFFGNNAIAGAFNIVTAKPDSTPGGWVRALYGEDGQFALEGAANLPINEKWSARAAVTFNGMDGWLTDVVTGNGAPHDRNVAGRTTLRFTPGDDFDATLKVEGSRNRNDAGLFYQIAGCPPPAPYNTPRGFCIDALANNAPIGLNNDKYGQSAGQEIALDTVETVLTANYRRAGHTFTSITGYYQYDYNLNLDTDATPPTLQNAATPERYHQFSQEFRVASPVGQTIEYLAGVYVQKDRLWNGLDFNFARLSPTIRGLPAFGALVPFLPLGQSVRFTQQETSWSTFGSVTWNLNERLKLSAGLRGSWVDKSYDWNLFYGTATRDFGGVVALPSGIATLPAALGLGTATGLNDSRSDHAWLPSARVQYEVAPQAMLYASYARGFKAGGFNYADVSGVRTNLPYQPEHVDAYEIGLKSELFDRSVRLNLAAFYSEYSNLQTATTIANAAGALISIVGNAAGATSQGVEFETQWVVNDQYRIAASGSYLDAKYTRYPNASPTILQQFNGIRVQDLSGRPTQYAPKWSGSIVQTLYTALPADYRLTSELSAYFSTNYQTLGTADDIGRQEGYVRLDLRLTLESPDRRWAFDLIGKNLNNARIYTLINPLPSNSFGSQIVQTQQPRNFAVQARYVW